MSRSCVIPDPHRETRNAMDRFGDILFAVAFPFLASGILALACGLGGFGPTTRAADELQVAYYFLLVSGIAFYASLALKFLKAAIAPFKTMKVPAYLIPTGPSKDSPTP